MGSDSVWVGRCPKCNAVRAVDVDSPDSLLESGGLLIAKEPMPQFTRHADGCDVELKRARNGERNGKR